MISSNETGGPRQETARNEPLPQSSKYHGQVKNRFDADTLEGMRARLPDYLSARGVELRRQGNRLVGQCPCHDDSNPSFAVFPNGKNCGCFVCDFSGDVFATAQWLGRASNFLDAVRDVAATLGVYLTPMGVTANPESQSGTPDKKPAKQPDPPFTLCEADRARIHAARLAFSDAFDAGEIDATAELLGLPLWALRWAATGESGLGWWQGSLAYVYPQGLKLRHPAGHKPRFQWLCGKALAPWRMEWALKPEVGTVYLTEGESDCLALIAAGAEKDGTCACVASPGTSFPQAWAAMFKGKKVVLCFDLDPPGRAATVKVAGMLRGHAAEILTWKGAATNE